MSIREIGKKINTSVVLVALVIVLVGFASFGLGRMSAQESSKPELKYHPEGFITTNDGSFVNRERAGADEMIEVKTGEGGVGLKQALYVGSKNSDKLHFPWCPGAQRIKEENKIWFSSLEKAEAAGYQPAGNCPGLK
jgi:hypothetical protein